MTIQAAASEQAYLGDGIATVFIIPFPFDTAADLKITSTDASGNILTLSTGFTISGGAGGTGNATFTVAPASGITITICDNPALTQPTDYVSLDAFPAESHERALDRVTRIAKRLYQLVQRSVRFPDGDVSTDGVLGSVANRKGKYLFFNAVTGAIEYAVSLVTTALSQSIIGQLLNPQTAGEIAAGVIPLNSAYQAGDLRRYGAVGNGVTNDTAAWNNAFLTGHRILGGGPEYTYLLNSAITLPLFVDVDLQGATLKPSGNHLNLNSILTPTATTTYSGAIASGQRVFVVSSATGIASGQWVQFVVSQATEETSAYPPSWAQVTNVAGTTITVDRAFQVDYPNAPTTATVNFYNDALLGSKCHIKNGIIDGSASTYSGGSIGIAARIVGFKDVALENLRLIGWNTTLGDDLLVTFQCIKVRVSRVYAVGVTCGSQIVNLVDSMDAAISDSTFDGSAFATGITRADEASMTNCTAVGRRRQEFDNSVSERSVRGFKFYGCKFARCEGNHATDYESPIKFQGVWRGIINGCVVVNSDMGVTYAGSASLNVSNQINGTISEQIIVSNNIIENCGGLAIVVSSSTSYGKHIVSGNQVRNCQGHGIYVPCANAIITDNQVYNWGLRNSGDNAIYHDSGATVTGNRFYHDTLTALGCIREVFITGRRYSFRDNISPTNPLFASGKDVVGFGATTIASGSTVQTPNHNLIVTPADITWFKITPGNNPTNDPGWFWVDTLTATTFKINVRADPGASGAVFGWRAEVPMPFTAP